MGRAPFDLKFRAVWHALFESFAPFERGLAPVYRHLIRGRAATLRVDAAADQESVSSFGFEKALSFLQFGASSAELGDLLRSYVEEIPQSVALVIAARPELVGPSGTLEPLGVTAGTVFAMVTRASCSARLEWFQCLDWWRVSRTLRGVAPCSQENQSAQKARPGFEDVATKDGFGEQYGHLSDQPGDKSRVCGVADV